MSTPIAQLYAKTPSKSQTRSHSPDPQSTASPAPPPTLKSKFVPPPPIITSPNLQGEDPFGLPSPQSPPLGGEPWRVSLSDDLDSSPRPSAEMEDSTFHAEQLRERQQKLSFLKGLLGAGKRRSSVQVLTSPSSPTTSQPGPEQSATSAPVGPSLHKNPSMSSLPNRNLPSSVRLSPPKDERRSLSVTGGDNAHSDTESVPPSPQKGGFGSLTSSSASKGMETVRRIGNKVGGKAGELVCLFFFGEEASKLILFFFSSVAANSSRTSLGVALPTKHANPDNVRSSVFSATTGTSLSPSYDPSENGQRDTLYSSRTRDTMVSTNPPESSFGELTSGGEEEEYDPLKEDGDATSIHRSHRSESESRPRFPPPKEPVPPLPTVNITRSSSEPSNGSSGTIPSKPAPSKADALPRLPIPPLPPARSPLRPPPIPSRPTSREPSVSGRSQSSTSPRPAHSPRQERYGFQPNLLAIRS